MNVVTRYQTYSLLLSACLSGEVWAQYLYTPLEQWQGEYLQQNQGAVYMKTSLQGFNSNPKGQNIMTNTFVHLYETKQKKYYVLSLPNNEEAPKLWKIPIGHYSVQKIVLNDNQGHVRQWYSQGKPRLRVLKSFLSNLGLVTLSPKEPGQLHAHFQVNAEDQVQGLARERFAGVLDGYTGKLQFPLAGKRLFHQSQQFVSEKREARFVLQQQRQIEMYYKVHLLNAPQWNAQIAQILSAQDLDLRQCYTDELERTDAIRGTVSFRFQILKSGGTMQNIGYRGGTLKAARIIECLYFNLRKMQFPFTSNVNGHLSFFFNYYDETGRAVR